LTVVPETSELTTRILILAPIGRDATLMAHVLGEAGMVVQITDATELADRLREGAGAVLITEEALEPALMSRLAGVLARQPAWSDVPFMILTGHPEVTAKARSFTGLGSRANITLIDRPVRMKTLVTTAEAVLRFRRRQYEIRGLMEELEERVQERDRFLAILGHELRNPLGAILLASQMVDPESGMLEQEYVSRIERQTRHLTRLVNDLLDLSRVTSGKIVLKKRLVDLTTLVQEVMQTLEAISNEQKLEIVYDCDEEKVLVLGDPTRLDQIISNILTNAMKYTPSGGHVRVRLECADGEAILRVIDDGVGIAGERIDRIFELFAQAENAIGRSQGGMGIGLALVRNLAELHGGSVGVSSEGVGKGSEFIVRLPLAESDGTSSAPSERRAAAADGESITRRIVVVEDNPDVRELLRLKLKRLGHEVEAANDGESGVQMILTEKPDIAFIDIGLPGMDGYQVANQIRNELGDSICLVALSGFGQPEDKKRALDAGFDEHMTKPAEMADIERVLSRLVK
jgi:signal transduction histidine kinase